MEFREKVDRKVGRRVLAGALLGCVVLFVALAPAGCSGPSWGKTETSSTESTTGTSAPVRFGDRPAAKAYFAAMAPILDKDYQGQQQLEQTFLEWEQTYGSSDLFTDKQAWAALATILEDTLPLAQEITGGYEAITPPEAFRTAHAALLENYRNGNAWAADVLAAIKDKRPADELMSMMSAGPQGISTSEVLAEFQDAATRVGVTLPSELIGVLTDFEDSSGQSI